MTSVTDPAAEREKRLVALSSVLAAVFLTSMKIVVGLLTHSLGILSEAAHSGLDLIAAIITMGAVRLSGQPPDREHPYGHGKIENLSALIEALLLLATCAWIITEAIDRLFFKSVHVEASIWSFVVMGTSIVIDLTRSRALMRVARKHNSQALEADALHFSTDVWSSAVVIAGLIAVTLGQWLHDHSAMQADWLFKA
ncbi:MAG TPA: cation diffusion facilitator family transporter, partial [Anaerolineae bacterium]